MLLTGRMIQAIGAGIIMPLMMTIITYLFPVEQRGKIMGNMGFAIIFAPAIAPTLAGFLLDYVSWRWLFIIMIPIVSLIILFALKYLVNVTTPQKVSLDGISVIYSTLGFGLILFGFSSAGSRGWGDPFVLVSIVGGLLITALFVIRQLRSSEPLLNLKVFSSRVFTMTTIVNIAVTILMYADLILLPLYLQNGRALTAFTAGLILLPGSIVNAVLSPIAGKLYDRIGAKPLFLAGTALIGLSMLAVVDLSSTTSIPYLIIRTIVLRIGLTCITMPLNTAALNALPRELVAHGSAVNNTIRQIAGAVGTAVIVTIYTTQLTGAIASADEAPMAAAAGNTYIYMLVIACLAFIICWFTPKKQKSPAA